MRRPLTATAIAAVMLVSACGEGGGSSTTTRLPAPEIVVDEWVSAVGQGDTAALSSIVASESLSFVIGIESRLAPAEITTLIDEGLPDQLVTGFWTSFGDAFTAIDGTAVGDLTVGGTREFDAGGARYSAVTVGDGVRTTEILVRRNLDGAWQVDLLATVGGGLTVQLVELAGEPADDRFRTLFEQWAIPAVEAAAFGDVDGELSGAVRDLRIALDASSR